jgi:hypothetical protein
MAAEFAFGLQKGSVTRPQVCGAGPRCDGVALLQKQVTRNTCTAAALQQATDGDVVTPPCVATRG